MNAKRVLWNTEHSQAARQYVLICKEPGEDNKRASEMATLLCALKSEKASGRACSDIQAHTSDVLEHVYHNAC